MFVAGIDLSTFAVDVVKVPLDQGPPQWHRFPLTGSDAFERARSVRDAMPGSSSVFWDDVLAVGIEEPAGRNPGVIFRVQGAVLARIPTHLLVEKLMPSQWRRLVGLPGNASKADVRSHATLNGVGRLNDGTFVWPQDACDAWCIALATRALITTPKEKAA